METNIGREFLKKTDLRNLGPSGRDKGLPKPPLEVGAKEDEVLINLPAPSEISVNGVDVRDAIERRESVREYSNEALTKEELSYLLWCTQGLKRLIPDIVALRNVPSAGGRNAFETYLLVNRVDGLEAGLYRYLALEHKVVRVDSSLDLARRLAGAFDEQEHIAASAVTFIWTAVEERMSWVYGDRGYRYLFIDAGHVCQNLYLAAESIDCGACAVGHFYDEQVNKLLRVDGIQQFVVYAATAGRKE